MKILNLNTVENSAFFCVNALVILDGLSKHPRSSVRLIETIGQPKNLWYLADEPMALYLNERLKSAARLFPLHNV